jgi:hypothetical protein
LVDERGQLSPHITHARPSDEAQELFSRSIAEAVLIDGEPIVTVDALSDGRLQSYVSVHKLMLRSVACCRSAAPPASWAFVPRAPALEGRFSDQCVDLLCLADQAAIALENARLVNQIRQQKAELEAPIATSRTRRRSSNTLLTRTAARRCPARAGA